MRAVSATRPTPILRLTSKIEARWRLCFSVGGRLE
jgi:hypothetical protein